MDKKSKSVDLDLSSSQDDDVTFLSSILNETQHPDLHNVNQNHENSSSSSDIEQINKPKDYIINRRKPPISKLTSAMDDYFRSEVYNPDIESHKINKEIYDSEVKNALKELISEEKDKINKQIRTNKTSNKNTFINKDTLKQYQRDYFRITYPGIKIPGYMASTNPQIRTMKYKKSIYKKMSNAALKIGLDHQFGINIPTPDDLLNISNNQITTNKNSKTTTNHMPSNTKNTNNIHPERQQQINEFNDYRYEINADTSSIEMDLTNTQNYTNTSSIDFEEIQDKSNNITNNSQQKINLQLISKYVQAQNLEPFKANFIKSRADTLEYLEQINNYFETNPLVDKTILYNNVLKGLPFVTFKMYTNAHTNTSHNYNTLVKWLLATYPPNIKREQIITKLFKLKFKKNEHPLRVLGKFDQQINKANNAIKIINKTRHNPNLRKWKEVTDEEKEKLYKTIFYLNNNHPKYHNNSILNKKIKDYITTKSPYTINQWRNVISESANKIRTPMNDDDPNFDWIVYEPTEEELSLISNKNHHNKYRGIKRKREQQNIPRRKYKRRKIFINKKRKYISFKTSKSKFNKRKKYKNHKHYKTKKFNKFKNQIKCFACGRKGHTTKNCEHDTHIKGFPVKKCETCKNKGHTKETCMKNSNKHYDNQKKFKKQRNPPAKFIKQYNPNNKKEINILEEKEDQNKNKDTKTENSTKTPNTEQQTNISEESMSDPENVSTDTSSETDEDSDLEDYYETYDTSDTESTIYISTTEYTSDGTLTSDDYNSDNDCNNILITDSQTQNIQTKTTNLNDIINEMMTPQNQPNITKEINMLTISTNKTNEEEEEVKTNSSSSTNTNNNTTKANEFIICNTHKNKRKRDYKTRNAKLLNKRRKYNHQNQRYNKSTTHKVKNKNTKIHIQANKRHLQAFEELIVTDEFPPRSLTMKNIIQQIILKNTTFHNVELDILSKLEIKKYIQYLVIHQYNPITYHWDIENNLDLRIDNTFQINDVSFNIKMIRRHTWTISIQIYDVLVNIGQLFYAFRRPINETIITWNNGERFQLFYPIEFLRIPSHVIFYKNNHIYIILNNNQIKSVINNYITFSYKNSKYNDILNTKPNSAEIHIKETIMTTMINDKPYIQQFQITHPFNKIIQGYVDTGADICCINTQVSKQYKEFIRQTREKLNIRTASGYITCNNYIPMTIQQKKENNGILEILNHEVKFWIIPELKYKFLIGRQLLKLMKAKLVIPGSVTVTSTKNDEEDYELFENQSVSIDKSENENNIFPIRINTNNINTNNKLLTTKIRELLTNYQHVIAKHEMDSGKFKTLPNCEFRIELKKDIGEIIPYVGKGIPVKETIRKEITRQLTQMRKFDIIEFSTSEWAHDVFCVGKKTGDVRVVFDLRPINSVSVNIEYPLPNVLELMHRFKGKKYITSIDMKGGYWHIPVKKEHRKYLAFKFDGVLYQWKRMCFGPKGAPAYFQYTMHRIFAKMSNFVIIYLDDISIVSNTVEEHIQHLKAVFTIIEKYGIRIRADKCIWGTEETEFLGFIINRYGIKPTQKYKQKILKVKQPTNKTEVQQFLGLINYLYRFIPLLGDKEKVLTDLTHKNVNFKWENKHQKAFDNLKHLIQKTEFLHHPDITKPFQVFTDASKYGIGGVLTQKDNNNKYHVIEFGSKLLNQTQQNWHCSEQEIYAIIYFIEKWRYLLINKPFEVFTDHKNLQELLNRGTKFKSGKLYRWAIRIQEFDFTCKHIPGAMNTFADYLSRDGATLNQLNPYLPINKKVPKVNKQKENNITEMFLIQHSYQHMKSDIPAHILPNTYTKNIKNKQIAHIKQKEIYIFNKNKDNYNKKYVLADEVSSGSSDSEDLPRNNNKTSKVSSIQTKITQITQILNNPITEKSKLIKQLEFPLEKDKSIIEKYKKFNEQIKKYNEKVIESSDKTRIYNDILITKDKENIGDYTITKILNKEIIKYKQNKDPFIFAIYTFLRYNNNGSLLNDIPEYYRNYVLTGRFSLKDDIVIYTYNNNIRIVAPSSLRGYILEIAHGKLHHGTRAMQKQILDQFWWPKIYEEIKTYSKQCIICQKSTKRKQKPGKRIKLFPVTQPFHTIHIDIVGPLPTTLEDNYRYILTIIDRFTRFCMFVPMRRCRTIDVVNGFGRWISVFGAPKKLISDNGKQFISHTFKLFTKIYNIKFKTISIYHPECNGRIERLHRWLKERLVLLAIDREEDLINGSLDWSQYLGIIQFIYNNTPNQMTDEAPSTMILGFNQPLFDIDENDPEHIKYLVKTPKQYIERLNIRRRIIQNKAKIQQIHYNKLRTKNNKKQKQGINQTDLEVGDYILYDVVKADFGNKNKLIQKWVGPYEITEIRNKGQNLKIRAINEDSPPFTVHVNKVKKYIQPKSSPKDIAMSIYQDKIKDKKRIAKPNKNLRDIKTYQKLRKM